MAEHVFIATSALANTPTAVCDPAALPFSLGDNTGVLIATSDLPAFLARHQLHVRGNPTPSEYEGINCLTLLTQAPTATVLDWNGNNVAEFRQLANKFAAQINRDVTLQVPHRCALAPTGSADTFAILIWSAPNGVADSIRPPEKFQGIPISCHDYAFAPAEQTFTVTDPSTGYTIAEMIDNTLYILHDICHFGDVNELQLFKIILDEVATLLTLPVEELAARQAELKRLAAARQALAEAEAKEREAEAKKQRAVKTRQIYVDLCQSRMITDKSTAQDQLNRANADISRLQRDLSLAVRQATTAQNYLQEMASPDGKTDRYGAEFDRLTSIDRVREVTINGQTIEVLTDTIYCTNPSTDQVHEIGRFKISIVTNCGSDYPLTFKNLDRQPRHPNGGSTMNAPHVASSGNPCLGNIKEMIPQLIGRHEYPALIMMAIAFLESVNIHDQWGCSITAFPLKKTTTTPEEE